MTFWQDIKFTAVQSLHLILSVKNSYICVYMDRHVCVCMCEFPICMYKDRKLANIWE